MSTTVAPPDTADLEPIDLNADGWPILRPTVLTVHRTSPEDVKVRQVILSLDDEKIATLLFGQTCSLEILPGRHRLRANNTLVWRTVEFDAPAGAQVRYSCVNRAPPGLYYLLFIFGVAPLFVTLEREVS